MPQLKINAERLLSDLRELATIGGVDTGVNRPAFSAEDIAARQWVRDRLRAAGLAAELDSAGNVHGRMTNCARAVLIGSHTDTVPHGGWLDGALGVVMGIEVARVVAEAGATDGVGIDVASFEDEEGTYLPEYGCRTFCGEDLAAEAAQATSQQGASLLEALAGLGPAAVPVARLDRGRTIAYLEAHIEQGPRLEAQGIKIGVVTGIVGIRTFSITVRGQADHAGTTPMAMRHDAGAAVLTFGARVIDAFRTVAAPDTVWNFGNAVFRPGAANVVPGEVTLALQFRDSSDALLEQMERIAREQLATCAAEFACTAEMSRVYITPPVPMDPRIVDIIDQAAAASGTSHTRMPSGAGHDAMTMARYVPTGMLFVPSIGGRSHHVSENTADADIVAGAEVLLRAALEVGRKLS